MPSIITRPAVYGLTINQGATFRFSATWKDENGDPVNLTGCSAKLVISTRAKPLHGVRAITPVTTLNSGTEITLGGVAGTIVIALSAVATAALDWDDPVEGVYDLYITFGSGDVVRLLEG